MTWKPTLLTLILAVGAYDSGAHLQSTSSIIYFNGMDKDFVGGRRLKYKLIVMVKVG